MADWEVPFRVPLIVAVVLAETAVVLTVNVAVVKPVGTVTVDGKVALPLLDAKVTTAPPVGATPLIVTVPVELLPPTTEVGESVTLTRDAGVIVRVAVFGVPDSVAVMVAEVEVDTALVVIVNVAVVAPAATVTEPGTVALELLELRLTVEPPVGAAAYRVMVPVDEVPPCTEAGLMARPSRPAGLIVSVAV